MAQTPTAGRLVHYTISEYDAKVIASQRKAAGLTATNEARPGDVLPATIIRVWSTETGCSNLQVHLDGPDTYWATSRAEREDPGYWIWPPRV